MASLIVKDAPEIPIKNRLVLTSENSSWENLRLGWNQSQKSGTWTDGPRSTFLMRSEHKLTDSLLRVNILEKVGQPTVRLFFNGELVEQKKILKSGNYYFHIPAHFISNSIETLTFEIEKYQKVSEVFPDEKRDIGLFINEIELGNVTLIPSDNKILFGVGGTAEPFVISGWSVPENGGTWTDGKEVKFEFSAPIGLHPSQMKIYVEEVLSRQNVTILVNDHIVGVQKVNHPGEVIFKIKQDVWVNHSDQANRIQFLLPDCKQSNIKNNDRRYLGLFIKQIEFIN